MKMIFVMLLVYFLDNKTDIITLITRGQGRGRRGSRVGKCGSKDAITGQQRVKLMHWHGGVLA